MPARATVRALGCCVSYLATFAVLGWPWLERARREVPADTAPDAWLIVWLLDWVRHALATAPSTLFDPPINYPAPAQLTGSEHFLSSQMFFAPLSWLTGDAVLSANLTAFATYPIAAVAMAALLGALGSSRATAAAIGVVYGLGLGAPGGQLHVLQVPHFYLPLAALALHRLRDRPTWGRTLALFASVLAGMFSSYHMAVYLTLTAAVWGVGETMRSGDHRTRFVLNACAAWAVAAMLLLIVSAPYFSRPEAGGKAELIPANWGTDHFIAEANPETDAVPAREVVGAMLASLVSGGLLQVGPDLLRTHPTFFLVLGGPLMFLLCGLFLRGTAALWRGDPSARTVVAIALAVAVLGTLVAGPAYCRLGGLVLPTPRRWLEWTPARFIRISTRALVMTLFGTAIIAAVGLDALRRRLSPRTSIALAVAVALLSVLHAPPRPVTTMPSGTLDAWLTRWSRFAPRAFIDNASLDRDRAAYERVARHVVGAGPGPLLEWPSTIGSATAVVGQMIHRQPAVRFYTGYHPAHQSVIDAVLACFPDAGAVDDLVDMTGLRWILLRPREEWPSERAYETATAAIVHGPRVVATTQIGGFVLVELDPTSRHPDWYRNLATGPQPGRTVLGTPVAPLPRDSEQAVVTAAVPPVGRAGAPLVATVTMANHGSSGWPAVLPRTTDRRLTVRLGSRWVAEADKAHTTSTALPVALRRDVPPGDVLKQQLAIVAPDKPGRYRLEIALVQIDGTDLSGTGNPWRGMVDLQGSPP